MIQFDIDQFYLFPSCPSGIPGKVSNMGRNKIVILIRKELEIVFPIPIKTDIVFYKPIKVITGKSPTSRSGNSRPSKYIPTNDIPTY